MNEIFIRNVPNITEKLKLKTVGIAGLGGIGSNAAISLARGGIGRLVLADYDKVEFSNLNRQHYFVKDIGKPKTEALKKYLKSINKNIELELFNIKITPSNVIKVFQSTDILIEAFDKAEDKIMLLNLWTKRFPEKPIILANGIAGYGKGEKIKIQRENKIYFCGDGESELQLGLCSARVALVANMQANLAIELLVNGD